jgi:hypothetical protein
MYYISICSSIGGSSGFFSSFPKLSIPGMRPLDSLQRPITSSKKSKKQKEEEEERLRTKWHSS